jgi:hypothetical protein
MGVDLVWLLTPPNVGPMCRIMRILVKDVSGTEYVLLHCARCGGEVAMKLDAERNITEQWILPDAA